MYNSEYDGHVTPARYHPSNGSVTCHSPPDEDSALSLPARLFAGAPAAAAAAAGVAPGLSTDASPALVRARLWRLSRPAWGSDAANSLAARARALSFTRRSARQSARQASAPQLYVTPPPPPTSYYPRAASDPRLDLRAQLAAAADVPEPPGSAGGARRPARWSALRPLGKLRQLVRRPSRKAPEAAAGTPVRAAESFERRRDLTI